jgi:hypothetical protein
MTSLVARLIVRAWLHRGREGIDNGALPVWCQRRTADEIRQFIE